jgi:hypothetical protein
LIECDANDPHQAILAGAAAQLDGIGPPTYFMDDDGALTAQTDWLGGLEFFCTLFVLSNNDDTFFFVLYSSQPFNPLSDVGAWSTRLTKIAVHNHILTLITKGVENLDKVEQRVFQFGQVSFKL